MSLVKGIKHGKEHRKPYYKSGRFDRSCRPGGSCPYCLRNRMHKHKRALQSMIAKEKEGEQEHDPKAKERMEKDQ